MDRGVLFLTVAMLIAGGCTRAPRGELTRLAPHAETQAAATVAQPVAIPQPTPSRLLPSPETLSDTAITARITASLMTDPAMTGADVSVNTTQGVVSLTGLVSSQEQAAIASAHAQRQDGVMRVDDHLAVNLR